MRLWLFKSYCNMTDLVWEFLFYFVKPFSLSNNKGILLSLVSATSDAKFMIRLSLAGLVCLDIFKIKKTPLQIYFVYIVNSGDYKIGKGNEVHVYSICGRLSFEAFRYLSLWIKVITKLPNSEQSYKGKVQTHNYINRQNQSTTGKLWKP